MSRDSIYQNRLLSSSIPSPQNPQSFANAIGRIANDTIQELEIAQGCMCEIRGESIHELALKTILLKIHGKPHWLSISPIFTPEATSIDIRTHRQRSKMCSRDAKASRSHEGVEEEFSRSREGHVGRDQAQFCIHGRRADISTLLQVVFIHDLPAAVCQPTTKVDPFGLLGFILWRPILPYMNSFNV